MKLNRSRTCARVLILASILTAAAAASANVLVVRSVGPSARAYPPGRSLPDAASLTLRANDMVTILGAGGTRTFRGPGTYVLSAPARASAWATAMGTSGRARVGAVRGPAVRVATAPWYVDVARGGNVCVGADAAPTLWRSSAGASAHVMITPAGAREGATVEWPAGQQTASWPAALPVASGSEYELRAGPGDPARIRITSLSTAPTRPQDIAAALIENGCDAQLDRLIATLPAE